MDVNQLALEYSAELPMWVLEELVDVPDTFESDEDKMRLVNVLARRNYREGTVRSCLFGDDETDLRSLLRNGADDATIADWWRAAMWGKQAGHGMERDDFVRPVRSMGAIGG